MLHYALVFFIVAIIAAIFGFGGIAAGAAEIAKVLFFIFLVLFIASLVAAYFGARTWHWAHVVLVVVMRVRLGAQPAQSKCCASAGTPLHGCLRDS